MSLEKMNNLTSLQMTKSKVSSKKVIFNISTLIIITLICLIFVPWQQSVIGVGKTTVFSPMDRPQTIQSQIPGRIKEWFVKEGDIVKKGQLLVEMEEVDSRFLDPLQIKRIELQKNALSLERNVSVASSQEKVRRAAERIVAANQDLIASRQNMKTTDLNLSRLKELNSKGLRSDRDLELAQLDYAKASTDLQSKEALLEIARRGLSISNFELAKIDASLKQELLKLDIELNNLSKRIGQRKIYSPVTGQVVRVQKIGTSQTVSAGDDLCLIVPYTDDQAVELLISDFDAPLVSIGRKVRLQFAGWPALQFTGWPSIAIGTFGGVISVIDAVDDGKSRYRLLIKPDYEAIKNKKEENWPSNRYLRPGAEVIGWVLLDTVPLGYEVWRQFNAFPPTVDREKIQIEGRLKLETRTSEKVKTNETKEK